MPLLFLHIGLNAKRFYDELIIFALSDILNIEYVELQIRVLTFLEFSSGRR